jgi:hypothetical protein
MKCEDAMELIHDRLTGELDAETLDALREHLAGCPGCAAEARALQSLWDELGDAESETPTPSDALRRRFDRMLEGEIAAESASDALAPRGGEVAPLVAPRPIRRRDDPRSLQRAAFGLALAASLAVALGAGILIGSTTASHRGAEDMAELRDEVRSLRSTVALALLSEPSPSERLNGVAYGREIQGQDHRVADALFTTLLEDSNVNVRLAALDALRQESAKPENRARLLRSIPQQDSPLVQISAIDVLLESGADRAQHDDLARLAQDPALDEVVRGYLRDRLERSPQ